MQGSRLITGLLLTAALALLAACGDVSTDDIFFWRKSIVKETAAAVPGTDQPYPNLASVPAAPTDVSSKAARSQLEKKLEADNKAKTYVPGKAEAPDIPAPPAALPPGFIEAEHPVQLAEAGTAAAGANSFAGAGIEPGRVAIVFFSEGSAAIDPRQIGKLKPILDELRSSGGRLKLIGHASQTGDGLDQSKVDNFNLSVQRADAVAKALDGLGLESGALEVSAEGDSKPVLAVSGIKGEAANRRVDVYYED